MEALTQKAEEPHAASRKAVAAPSVMSGKALAQKTAIWLADEQGQGKQSLDSVRFRFQ